jgi:4-amino-4-deoxy-L-arabinose transferase-like glycosyltransferase
MIVNRTFFKILVGVVFFVSLCLRLYQIGELSSWQDETKEAYSVHQTTIRGGVMSGRMVKHGVRYAQPPLSYYFQEWGINNLGLSIFGMRIHSAIMGALFCALFALLFCKMSDVKGGSAFALLCLIIPVFNHNLIYYAQESRPYMTATFLSLLWLYVGYIFVFEKEKTGISDFVTLVMAQLAFLLSVGLQTPILVLSSAVALCPMLLFKDYRSKVLLSWMASGLAVLVYLPWQTLPLKKYSYITTSSGKDLFSALSFDAFTGFSFPGMGFLTKFYSFNMGLDFAGVLPLVLSVATIVLAASAVISWKRQQPKIFCTGLYLLGVCLLFPVIFYAIFNRLIDYKIQNRYFIASSPFVIAFVFWSSEFVVSTLSTVCKGRPWVKIISTLVVALVTVVAAYTYIDQLPSSYRDRSAYKKLYNKFDELAEAGDLAYSGDHRFSSAYTFYSNHKIDKVSLVPQMLKDLKSGKLNDKTKKVFFLYYSLQKYDLYKVGSLTKNKNVKVIFSRGAMRVSVIRAASTGMMKTLHSVFNNWDRAFKKQDDKKSRLVRTMRGYLR